MVPHDAFGVMGGLRLLIKGASGMDPYIDISGWALSGDEGDIHEKNRDFFSMESNNSTLIMESSWGLDIDCNYWAIKGEIGTKLPKPADNVKLVVVMGYFNLLQVPAAWIGTNMEDNKQLGWEIDVRFVWTVAENVDLFLGWGSLNDAFFFKDMFNTNNSVNMAAGGITAKF